MRSRDHPHVAVNTKEQGEEEGASPPARLLLLHTVSQTLLGPSRQAEVPCQLLQGRGGQEPTDVHSPLQLKLARKCRDKERGTEEKGNRATCLTLPFLLLIPQRDGPICHPWVLRKTA